MSNIYSTNKIIYHPELLVAMKKGEQPYPIQLHLMPDNRCNHNCVFCSFRLFENKNTELFDRTSYIPENIMIKLLDDFKLMNGQAVEVTGGGEPLLYPYRTEMFKRIIKHEFDIGLVTNGVKVDQDLAKLIGPHLTWARISIDAGTEETYSILRKTNKSDFAKALDAVSLLKRYSKKPDFKLGVGFVIENGNEDELVKLCRLAKENGADNVRIGATFHPEGIEHFNKGILDKAENLVAEAKQELEDEVFTIHDRLPERINNMKIGKQEYKFCGMKEVLCVVGGDCSVFTCCSLAFNKNGLIGNLKDEGLKDIWDSDKKKKMFRTFDPTVRCGYHCLYEYHNKFILKLLNKEENHVNFI